MVTATSNKETIVKKRMIIHRSLLCNDKNMCSLGIHQLYGS